MLTILISFSDNELQHFLAVSKMVTPITWERRKGETPITVPAEHTVKVDEDGSVIITGVEYIPSSSGREKFGDTLMWNKFPEDTPQLIQFSK